MGTKRDVLKERIDLLECYYFLVQNLDDQGREHVAMLRALLAQIPKTKYSSLINEVRKDIGRIRRETKCLISDEQVRNIVRQITSEAIGFANIPKWYVDKYLFGNYERVFPRWPHIPLHGFVQFDTDLERKSPYSILVIEGMLFDDAVTMWRGALQTLEDGLNFNTRSKKNRKSCNVSLGEL